MKAGNRGRPPRKRRQRSGVNPHGSVTDALREEAERGWADADRKVATGRRRASAKRRAAARKGGAAR
jgi:hypothetical protein